MANNEDSMVLNHIIKDERYINMTSHDIKVLRGNMITAGTATKYELACVQYWLMHKEDRLPWSK